MFSTLKTLLRRAGADLPEDRTIRGLPVTLINTRPEIDSEDVFARLDAALELIERYQPSHFRRLGRDFARIQVRRFPCRGAYFPDTRVCLVELTFVVNPVLTGALALTALAVWGITGDGKADAFEGYALVGFYVILAALTWYE